MQSPKLPAKEEVKYKYYAGFSHTFVQDVLERFSTSATRVLDPWNGSGTTTSVCAQLGIQSVGADINPAMLPVAWARLARADLVLKLCKHLAAQRCSTLFSASHQGAQGNDLLSSFFDSKSAANLRVLRAYLINAAKAHAAALDSNELAALSGAAFILLSEVLREALRPLRGTNPSWFTRPRHKEQLVQLDRAELHTLLLRAIAGLEASFKGAPSARPDHFQWPDLRVRDSRQNLADLGKFNLVVTSPPYCTRIDYAVATIPEQLALGELGEDGFLALRREIMGSVVTEKCSTDLAEANPASLLGRTLTAIKNHPTKAAGTYYSRFFSKYFDDLIRSLSQLTSVIENGHIAVVVQSSYFKDVKIDLSGIVTEALLARGLTLLSSRAHFSKSSIAWSNPKFKLYRSSNVDTEDVLIFATSPINQ